MCMQTTESVKTPIGLNAGKLSPAQEELVHRLAHEDSSDFLDAIDTWISSSFANRNEHTEIDFKEWHAMFYIFELQKLIREIRAEHDIEQSLEANDLPHGTLPSEVWEVIKSVEHVLTELDAKEGKVTPGTYKHLMKATNAVTMKYSA
jgi:hypothetical protein